MLKKVMASVALSAAAFTTLPAIAQEGPKLSDGEKATMKTFQQFNACVKEGAATALQNAAPVVKSMIEAGNTKESIAARVAAGKKGGLSEEQAAQLTAAAIQIEAQTMMELLVSGEEVPVKAECAKKLGIGNKEGTGFSTEFSKKLKPLMEKMQKLYKQQDGATPKGP